MPGAGARRCDKESSWRVGNGRRSKNSSASGSDRTSKRRSGLAGSTTAGKSPRSRQTRTGPNTPNASTTPKVDARLIATHTATRQRGSVTGPRAPARRSITMATFGIILRFRGGTREQYENTLSVVHPDGGEALPESQLLHLAGPTQDGWLVMAVHDSRESWERFRDDTL